MQSAAQASLHALQSQPKFRLLLGGQQLAQLSHLFAPKTVDLFPGLLDLRKALLIGRLILAILRQELANSVLIRVNAPCDLGFPSIKFQQDFLDQILACPV